MPTLRSRLSPGRNQQNIFHHLLFLHPEVQHLREAAIAQRDPFPLLWAASGFTKPVRETPRWPALAKMMNLAEAM